MKWFKYYKEFRKGMRVSSYMTSNKNNIKLILFTAVFSLCFINIYRPFDSTKWYNISSFYYFVYSSLLVLTGILVIAASRYAMSRFIKRNKLHNIEYFLWVVVEILILSIIYTIYTIAARPELTWWHFSDVIIVFEQINLKTILVIILPYIVSWLYFSNEDKRKKIRSILEKEKTVLPNALLQFRDENDELKFSAKTGNIVLLESADNYVEITYLNQGVPTKFLLRNTLKRLSNTSLQNSPIKRCHRSRMVNFAHVEALRKQPNGLYLEIDIPNIQMISVSKSYQDDVTEFFLHYKEIIDLNDYDKIKNDYE
ncbi:MAG: LytTR family transcriptional regulator DNA-binding domain-containing protein [Bacteroidaceae bacterium]